MVRNDASIVLSPRGEVITTLIILLIFSPFVLFASSLPLRIVASIIGGSQIGLTAFAFAVPLALFLMLFFVRMLSEIRDQGLELLPDLKARGKSSPPAIWLGAAIALCITLGSASLWWHIAFPPGALLLKGEQVEMRVIKVTQAPTHDGSESFYSQQIWLEHVRNEYPAGGNFPLLAPSWIDEDRQLASLQKHSPLYNPGTVQLVWTVDGQNGPFYGRRYSAWAFAALLWWLCAGFVVVCTVAYLNLVAKFPDRMRLWQKRFRLS